MRVGEARTPEGVRLYAIGDVHGCDELLADAHHKITLDLAHFMTLGYRQDEIETLAPYAGHVHLRQARQGALQAKMEEGTINFSALFGALRDAGPPADAVRPIPSARSPSSASKRLVSRQKKPRHNRAAALDQPEKALIEPRSPRHPSPAWAWAGYRRCPPSYRPIREAPRPPGYRSC